MEIPIAWKVDAAPPKEGVADSPITVIDIRPGGINLGHSTLSVESLRNSAILGDRLKQGGPSKLLIFNIQQFFCYSYEPEGREFECLRARHQINMLRRAPLQTLVHMSTV